MSFEEQGRTEIDRSYEGRMEELAATLWSKVEPAVREFSAGSDLPSFIRGCIVGARPNTSAQEMRILVPRLIELSTSHEETDTKKEKTDLERQERMERMAAHVTLLIAGKGPSPHWLIEAIQPLVKFTNLGKLEGVKHFRQAMLEQIEERNPELANMLKELSVEDLITLQAELERAELER